MRLPVSAVALLVTCAVLLATAAPVHADEAEDFQRLQQLMQRQTEDPTELRRVAAAARAYVEAYPTAIPMRRMQAVAIALFIYQQLGEHATTIEFVDSVLGQGGAPGPLTPALKGAKAAALILTGRVDQAREIVEDMEQSGAGRTAQSLRQLLDAYDDANRPADEREPATDFTLRDLGGENEHSLSDFRGRWVVIDFWATWCGPCKKLILDHLVPIHDAYGERGVTVISVGVNRNDTADRQRRWGEENDIHYLKLFDADGTVRQTYGVGPIPHVLLIDPEGRLVFAGTGVLVAGIIRDVLAREVGPLDPDAESADTARQPEEPRRRWWFEPDAGDDGEQDGGRRPSTGNTEPRERDW